MTDKKAILTVAKNWISEINHLLDEDYKQIISSNKDDNALFKRYANRLRIKNKLQEKKRLLQ